MPKLLFVLSIVAVTFMIYSLVDCAFRPKQMVRVFPKGAWLLIILIPVVGGVLWFAFGRGRQSQRVVYRSLGPDDDPEFLRDLGKNAAAAATTDETIRDLEQRLNEPHEPGEEPGPSRGDRAPGA